MLAAMVALACELAWIATRSWLVFYPGRPVAVALADLLFFSALVIGLIALVLMPIVLRSRRVLPPRVVTFWALVVGGAPLVVAVCRLWI